MNDTQKTAMATAFQNVMDNAALSDTYKSTYAQGVHRALLIAGVIPGRDGDVGRSSKRIVTAWAQGFLNTPGTQFTVSITVKNDPFVPTQAAIVNAVVQGVAGIRSGYYRGTSVQGATVDAVNTVSIARDGSVRRAN